MRARKTTINPISVVYVTRDIERALGMIPNDHYRIIAGKTPYAEEIQAQYPDYITLIDNESGDDSLDTYDLLAHPITKTLISKNTAVLVFKNTSRIERYCKESNWQLLNPSADLAEKIENKVTQVKWLGDLAQYLPPHQILKVADIVWGTTNPTKSAFIIQWAHSHTGDGTALVRSEKELDIIKTKFPAREARVTEFIRGSMFTANICVNENGDTVVGNISYQITGILPFTDNPFSTIGNDWSVPHTILTPEKIDQFNKIAHAIGQHIHTSGWRGLFGIDCIYDEERDNIHLIEINSRQPASTTFESQLQSSLRTHLQKESLKKNLVTIFESHIAALTDLKSKTTNTDHIIEINDGAQIIQRLTVSANILMESPAKIAIATSTLQAEGYTVIEYPNIKANSDILRIQSQRGIMETHMKFNSRGKKIIDILLA